MANASKHFELVEHILDPPFVYGFPICWRSSMWTSDGLKLGFPKITCILSVNKSRRHTIPSPDILGPKEQFEWESRVLLIIYNNSPIVPRTSAFRKEEAIATCPYYYPHSESMAPVDFCYWLVIPFWVRNLYRWFVHRSEPSIQNIRRVSWNVTALLNAPQATD